MKPWLHQSLLATSTYYSNQDHLHLSLPLTPHGGHRREPLLHPYWPRPLSLADGPAGLANIVLKPVAVRLTNIYGGLPMSLNLFGPPCGTWEASCLPSTRAAADCDRQPGSALCSSNTTTSRDYSTAATSSAYLSQLLSRQLAVNSQTESAPPDMSQMFKELISLRMQLLQDKTTSAETREARQHYGNHSPRDLNHLPSYFNKSHNATVDFPSGTCSEMNVAVIPPMPKQASARRDTPEKKPNSVNVHSKTQLGHSNNKKLKNKFTAPISKVKKRKYERAKNSEEYASADVDVKDNKNIASGYGSLTKMNTHVQIVNEDHEQLQNVELLLNKGHCSNDKSRPKVLIDSNCERSENYSSPNLCRSLASPADDKKTFSCPQCRYITDRKNNLKRHIVTMHQESSKTLECCGVVFQSKASLRDHNSVFHRGGYRCQICSRNFCRKALLRRHLTVHSGQKDFFCALCGYATSHKSNLERHQKVHNKNDSASGVKVKRDFFLNRKKDCRGTRTARSESFKKSQNLQSDLTLTNGSKLDIKCGSIAKNNVKGNDNEPVPESEIQERTVIKKETLPAKTSSVDYPISEFLLYNSENLNFNHSSTINNSFGYSNEPDISSPDYVIEQSNDLSSHPISPRPTTPVIYQANGGQQVIAGSKNPPPRVSKSKALASSRPQHRSQSLHFRKRLFHVRYECADCKTQFSLQSDLGLHELQCKKKVS